jgi:integrase/recombinase XerD
MIAIFLFYVHVNEVFLTFERAKTQLTSRSNPMSVTVYINDDMRAIMNRWGNLSSDNKNFIFPFLKPGLTALEEYTVVTRVTRFMNDWTKQIGEKLNLKCNLTTIVSRHSFSTRLKRSGVSTEFIQESLGHSDKRTTENYLDGFENEVKKEYASKLLEFKNM